MPEPARLFPELRGFLEAPGPAILLLRGSPGTGKTALVLNLLQQFRGRRVLVSSRAGAEQLRRDFPWFLERSEESKPPVEILDGDRLEEPPVPTPSLPEGRGPDTLTTPEDLDRAFLSWVPAPLRHLWGSLKAAEPTLLVLDSWDALNERILPPPAHPESPLAPAGLERQLLRLVRKAAAHLVLVLETQAPDYRDYVADMVLETSQSLVEDRLERWVRVLKVRGQAIRSPRYPYTLFEGHFRSFEPSPLGAVIDPPRFEEPPRRTEGDIWPGHSDFAGAFGGLPLGRYSSLEYDPDVPEYAVRLLNIPIAAYALRHDGKVLYVPSLSTLAGDVIRTYQSVTPQTPLVRNLLVITPDFARMTPVGTPAEAVPESPSLSGPDRVLGDGWADRFLQDGTSPSRPGLGFVHVGTLRVLGSLTGTLPTPESFPQTVQRSLHGRCIHLVFYGLSGDPLMGSLSGLAARHLELVNRAGRIFLRGVRPSTPNHVLVPDGEREYRLYPVV